MPVGPVGGGCVGGEVEGSGDGSGDGGGEGSGDGEGSGEGSGDGSGDGDGSGVGEGSGEGEGSGDGDGDGAGLGDGPGWGIGPGAGGGGPNVGPGPDPGVKRSPLTIGTSEGGSPDAVATASVPGVGPAPPRACGSNAMYGTPAGVTPPSKAPPSASETVPLSVVAKKRVSKMAPTIVLSTASATMSRLSSDGRIHGRLSSGSDLRPRNRSSRRATGDRSPVSPNHGCR